MDVALLKKQYSKLTQRQRQAKLLMKGEYLLVVYDEYGLHFCSVCAEIQQLITNDIFKFACATLKQTQSLAILFSNI